jgi:beta-N-acetylhexosaminidase
MTGHLYHEEWDPDYPVSLSRFAITDMLRDSLGFKGVVISDELFMRALSDNYGLEETVVTTINAGTDILLFNTNIRNDRSLVQTVINIVMDNVQNGTISETTINDSYQRIIRLKQERLATSIKTDELHSEAPAQFRIGNYPNPFNPATTITVSTMRSVDVSVDVFDALGRNVRTLHEGQLERGVHSVRFDGSGLTSGTYFVVVRSASATQTHAITLVK